MLAEFLLWWRSELTSLVPRSVWRYLSALRPDSTLAIQNAPAGAPAAFAAALSSVDRTEDLGVFGADETGLAALSQRLGHARKPGRIVLLVPARNFLEKALEVPAAARRHLQGYVQGVLPEETPYEVDDVYWRAVPSPQQRRKDVLSVRLRVIRRIAVQPFMDALASAGISATHCGTSLADDLLPLPSAHGGDRFARPLALVSAALAVLVIAVPLIWQSLQLSAVEARLAGLKPEYQKAAQLQRRLSGMPAAASEGSPYPLRTLAALTDALPNDTSLVTLEMQKRALTMTGRSADATQLLGKLEAIPFLREPAFTSAITRDPKTGIANFSIKAEVRP